MSNKKTVMAVIGTRPDAIKMCPLINEMKSRDSFEIKVCATGQHKELLSDVLDAFGVSPDYNLAIMKEGQDLFDITVQVLEGMKKILKQESPCAVFVHGDTTSAFASALAAFYLRIPVYHVEAGLRTYDIHSPFPEEFNRRAIGVLAQKHFAPTAEAGRNLLSEGVDEENISVTGNTVIDAMACTVKNVYKNSSLNLEGKERLIILTAHRRENCGEAMERIFSAVRRIIKEYTDVKVVYPMHPNPKVRECARRIFDGCERIYMCEPLDVFDFHNLLARSYLVLTDSGGIQEEAAALGKPVLVLRNTTERQEGIAAGGIRLAGTCEETVYRGVRELLQNSALHYAMSVAKNPYGDGKASVRIVDIVEGMCS